MLNLYGLKYFADSARLGSMTKAATLNHLSRPAISQAIQKLEHELGVKLLVHQRRSFQLTSAGLSLLKKSEPLLTQVELLKTGLRAADEPLMGGFKIGSSRTLATVYLPEIMAKLHKTHPLVEFHVQLANSEGLMQRLSNREVDVAYFIGEEFLNGFKHVVARRGHYCLIKPKSLRENEAHFAITEPRPETERVRTVFEQQFGREIPIFAEVHSWDAIWTWVNQGICGGLVPDFMLEAPSFSSKKFEVLLPKVFPYELKVMFAKSKADHPLVKGFLNLCV